MESAAENCVRLARDAIRAHDMIRRGEKTLIAVSGGPDSLCLLHVLLEEGYSVEVAYFDHGTRLGESAEDGAFVAQHARGLGVAFHAGGRAAALESRGSGLGFEAYARSVRYDFLKRTAQGNGCAVIATGHHADDQAETVLMRLLRGAGAGGLAGIPPVREEDGIRIVRPLIGCTREEILAFLRARGITARTDRSNADIEHFRNRIRHELLPLLRGEYNPRVSEALARIGDTLRYDEDLLRGLTEEAYAACVWKDSRLDRVAFAALHPALQRRVVLTLARRNGADPDYGAVVAAAAFVSAGKTGARCDLGCGILLHNGRNVSEVTALRNPPMDLSRVAVAVPGITHAFGKRIETSVRARAPALDPAAYCGPSRQVFDADALNGELGVRRRRPGDRIVPLGMSGARKLKDYFAGRGIPVPERDRALLLTAGEDIVWIVGGAVAAGAAITERTTRVVEVRVIDSSERSPDLA